MEREPDTPSLKLLTHAQRNWEPTEQLQHSRLVITNPEVYRQKRTAAMQGDQERGSEPVSEDQPQIGPSSVAFFTICSKNFLAYARTLHDSLCVHYPNRPFFVALCDRLDNSIDITELPFEIIEIASLAIPDVEEMAQRYNITEFNTAIKPFVFNYIFTKRGIPTVVYLDPDILVVDRFTEMDQLLENDAEAILTPHILEPAEVAELHDQRLLLYGVYNLGFLALRHTPRVKKILEWWGRRLQYHCVIKLEEGLFVDQRWADLFPAFIPGTRILDHPGYNVAYWNLPQRRVVLRDGRWFANNQPLRFVHFSGHMLDDHRMFSRHTSEVTLGNIGDLQLLVKEYRRRVFANNHHFYRRLPYAFSWNGESGVNLHTPQSVAHPTQSGGEAFVAEEAVVQVTTQEVGPSGVAPAGGDFNVGAGHVTRFRWRHILTLAQVMSLVYHRYGGMNSLRRAWYAFRRYGLDHCKQKAVMLYRSYREERSARSQHVMRLPSSEPLQTNDPRPRLLYFDWAVPRVDHDSGSVTTMCLLDIFLRLGYRITYLPGDLRYDPPYGDTLTNMGIECVHYPAVTSVKQYLETNAKSFQLVVLCRGPVVGPWLKLIRAHAPNALLIFNTVDLHYVREQRQAELEGSTLALAQAERTKAVELNLIRNTDLTIVLSSEELYTVRNEIPDAPLCVLPLIVREVPGRRKPFEDRRDLIFIGGFRHEPNIDAVRYFVREIFPLIRRRLPDVRFHVVGSNPTGEVHALAKTEGVFVHGFVQDLSPILDGIKVAVAPLRFGAGIKGKIGKCLSYGVPTVATPMAVEGMGLRDHHNILVADTPAGFADAVEEAYTDRVLWEYLSDAGLTSVRDSFSSDALVHRVGAIVKSLEEGIRPVDSTYEIESFTAYAAHRARMEAEYARRYAFEASLLPAENGEFSTSGYCVMCGCETTFVTSFMYAHMSSSVGRMVPNWREHVACVKCKHVNRIRAAIHLLYQVAPISSDALIYVTEQVTPLYRWLRERYPLTQGSEYLGPAVELGALVDGVRNEDVTRLTFDSNSFDYVLTFDVLEHVPNFLRGVEEIYRVLKPGGLLLITVPFARDSRQNVIRAALDEKGEVVHRLPPEYHGNPIDSEHGALCFQYFGWEFLDQMRDVGFRKVHAVLYWSARCGYLGEGEQLLLTAERPLE
ncbi:MAG: glycosyltransferase [bacterium]|uniref:Glycosyltransferase n=1 Tax=Candidatus Methylomirabilis tolerans TaxID=3123416 RepID=A0AAJ1AGN2_9BACT|nr:glycosyltransferase [Candidatus Methylomirabilis sp.]